MSELPILFSGPMVRAILSGRKTQTRRIVKLPAPYGLFGAIGGFLWVRETLCLSDNGRGAEAWTYGADGAVVQLPHGDPRVPAMLSWAHHKEGSTCVSRYMPRWASRITLRITAHERVERLSKITPEDALAEGIGELAREPAAATPWWLVRGVHTTNPVEAFLDLFRSINAKRMPEDDPYVRVITFEVVK